ncbi:MAG TPA: class I SAM-dependent methyltransferase [Opitutaceae bacterium]|nr:class I SAM-dependent methyltransferase [Opitutaceae bacterium]
MAFKHWPLVRDARFALKMQRYLRGARKRRPDLDWDEFRRVARQFKQDDMGSFPERGYLFQLAADAPAGAQVVEIGSWMGASTCFLAAGLKGPGAKIYAVDNFQGLSMCGEDVSWYQRHFRKLGTTSTLEIFRANFAALGLADRAEPVVSDSLAAARALAAKRGSIDLIFVDGDHSYEGCKADIDAWLPFVRAGGVMAFHDFGSRASGVTRAIFETTKAGKFAEIVGVANTIIAFRV